MLKKNALFLHDGIPNMSYAVRKTTPKKRAVWTRTWMKIGKRKTISEEREIMGLLECD